MLTCKYTGHPLADVALFSFGPISYPLSYKARTPLEARKGSMAGPVDDLQERVDAIPPLLPHPQPQLARRVVSAVRPCEEAGGGVHQRFVAPRPLNVLMQRTVRQVAGSGGCRVQEG